MGGEIFVWVMIGLFALLVVFILLLGMFYPGSGADQLDWRPTRSPELDAQNEEDDLSQMLEATNAKRRKRGEGALTEAQMHARVQEDRAMRARMRGEAGDASIEEEREQLRQAREARAARRRAREEGNA